jgi:preprotein translocase subunit SecD
MTINQNSLLTISLVVIVAIASIFYSLPNLFGQKPVLELRFTQGDGQALQQRVEQLLNQATIAFDKTEIDAKNNDLRLFFPDTDQQLKAADLLRPILLPENINVTLNFYSQVPKWLAALGAKPLNLGLDLRGGVHFLLEVDFAAALKQLQDRTLGDVRSYLRDENLRYTLITLDKTGVLQVRFSDTTLRDTAFEKIKAHYRDLTWEKNNQDGFWLYGTLTETAIESERKSIMEQNTLTLRNRVNELGVAEPLVQQQGATRIVVELPGIQDPARAKEILGATATLEFRLVHGQPADWQEASRGRVPVVARLYKDRNGEPILLNRQVIVTGDNITNASSGIEDKSGSAAVFINLDGAGARRMGEVTKDNIGNLMAVVFIENKIDYVNINGEVQKRTRRVEEVINVATIRDRLDRRFQISGLSNSEEARDLALLLRAGSLKAPMEIVEERTIGPSLGQENIERGLLALLSGFVLVLLFMIIRYKLFGLYANLALLTNILFLIALLSLLQATLTLPGIAGIVLTLGMAVDANVLIFQRIREEIANGNSPQASIHVGYTNALSTILDANITTLIAAVVLFSFGAGPIKGFAITLSLGILTSMFTAIIVSRVLVNATFGRKARIEKLPI